MATVAGTKFKTTEEYFKAAPVESISKLSQIRDIVLKNAPGAEETISYNMPAVTLNGIVVWYAGYKNHVGLYPKPAVIQQFAAELQGYKVSKGAIQFPLDRPLPAALIAKIVKFRVKENKEAIKVKGKK